MTDARATASPLLRRDCALARRVIEHDLRGSELLGDHTRICGEDAA